MLLEPAASCRGLALAHQHGEPRRRAGGIDAAQAYRQQPSRVRVHGGLPELLGAHLAQALEARDRPAALAHPVLAQLVLDVLQLTLVETVELAHRALAL